MGAELPAEVAEQREQLDRAFRRFEKPIVRSVLGVVTGRRQDMGLTEIGSHALEI